MSFFIGFDAFTAASASFAIIVKFDRRRRRLGNNREVGRKIPDFERDSLSHRGVPICTVAFNGDVSIVISVI
jgi:hypothetical protein